MFLKPTSSMKSGAFAENGKKEKYTEPLSSGKVYAVHLFVLVSSVKIFAHYTENRASKSISMPKKPTTPSHHPKKKYYPKKLLHYLLCIPQKSQLNKMFANFIFSRCSECATLSSRFRLPLSSLVRHFYTN